MDIKNSELGKSCYGMGELHNTVANGSICRIPISTKISCHVPEKNIVEAVTRDMASSEWLK